MTKAVLYKFFFNALARAFPQLPRTCELLKRHMLDWQRWHSGGAHGFSFREDWRSP